MTVSELISYLNKFRPSTVVRAVDNNGNSSPFVMIRDLGDSVEITSFPDYTQHYYREKYQSDEYDDRDYLPGPCNGDFLEALRIKNEM